MTLGEQMKKLSKCIFLMAILLGAAVLMSGCSELLLLYPKGPVGGAQRLLIIMAFALMLIVVIPVFIMLFWFSRRYRASNTQAPYAPKWHYSTPIEWAIWLVPVGIIIVLGYLTWTSTFQLDPYKPIHSERDPLRIEVVSMDWNWLFIFPDQNIASMNELVFPAGVPLSFRLTSASVMTSFFIPQLGSQMYAMAGMQTRLNLMADETGIYAGQNQEFSGSGYTDMHFKAIATSPERFRAWVDKARQSPVRLDLARYEQLSQPTRGGRKILFASVRPNLFEHVVHTYMGWMGDAHGSAHGASGTMEHDGM
jgi:cytochrome o ubiquinol oxidase subunit 2